MKKLIIGSVFMVLATAAYADCVTNTIFKDGKMVVCTTCCMGGSCTTTCY